MAAAIAYGFWVGRERPSAYFGLMLFLTSATVGVFASQDLLLFYVFFEAMMIPLYLLIGVWGGPGRLGATVKFVIYTMAGSLLMLASVIVFGLSQGSFDLVTTHAERQHVDLPRFARRVRDQGAALPAPRLAAGRLPGVVARGGGGAVGRDLEGRGLRLHPDLLVRSSRSRSTTCACSCSRSPRSGSSTGRCSPSARPDVRGVIAYSSLAQMGLITIGIFSVSTAGISGAVLQSVNHGLISASLFLLAGTIERRTSTGSFERLGGMARGRPALATMLMVTGIIALAVPGSSAFAGEFLILLGVFGTGWGWAVAGATGIVLAAMYMLRLISAVLHREPGPAVHDAALDLRPAELGIVVPLVACLLALSAWPAAISGNVLADTSVSPAPAARAQPVPSQRPAARGPDGLRHVRT